MFGRRSEALLSAETPRLVCSPVSFEAGGVRYVWTREPHDLWIAVRDRLLRPFSR
jgi:hypothetical protein